MTAQEVIKEVLPLKAADAAEQTFNNFLLFLRNPVVSGQYVADLTTRIALLTEGNYERYPLVHFKASKPPETPVKLAGYINVAVADIPDIDFVHTSAHPRIRLPENLWTQTRQEPFGQLLSTVKAIYMANLFADGCFSKKTLDKSPAAESVHDLLMDMVKIWDIPGEVLKCHPLGRRLLEIKARYGEATSFTEPAILCPLPFLGPSAVACARSLPQYFKDVAKPITDYDKANQGHAESTDLQGRMAKMSKQKHLLN